MIKVIGVRFKKAGKIYYFDPAGLDIEKGNFVVVETARGIEFGECGGQWSDCFYHADGRV